MCQSPVAYNGGTADCGISPDTSKKRLAMNVYMTERTLYEQRQPYTGLVSFCKKACGFIGRGSNLLPLKKCSYLFYSR